MAEEILSSRNDSLHSLRAWLNFPSHQSPLAMSSLPVVRRNVTLLRSWQTICFNDITCKTKAHQKSDVWFGVSYLIAVNCSTSALPVGLFAILTCRLSTLDSHRFKFAFYYRTWGIHRICFVYHFNWGRQKNNHIAVTQHKRQIAQLTIRPLGLI